ncbi:hypothetical protein DWG93_14405 [Escherichia coli]|nr:hypothetical protein [Escherichia coli]
MWTKVICGQRAVLYNKLWISFEMIQAGLNEFSIICKEYVTPQHKKIKMSIFTLMKTFKK